MPITTDSPIANLALPASLVKALDRGGYKTIRHLTTRTAAFFNDRGYTAKEIAAITKALAERGLEFAKPIGDWNLCGTCPTCETCGNPRAQTANAVATDHLGRAGHIGRRIGDGPCHECREYHRELVAGRALELAGRLV